MDKDKYLKIIEKAKFDKNLESALLDFIFTYDGKNSKDFEALLLALIEYTFDKKILAEKALAYHTLVSGTKK